MDSLYLLIPVALIFAGIVVWLLIWAIDNGQYDDLEKDAWRSLHDELDTPTRPPQTSVMANQLNNEQPTQECSNDAEH